MTDLTALAEVRVGAVTTDRTETGAFHGGQCACAECMKHDLDRHAEANAALAALFRRVFMRGVR